MLNHKGQTLIGVQTKNGQVREEGLEDSQGGSVHFQGRSFKHLDLHEVPVSDAQDNPDQSLKAPCQ